MADQLDGEAPRFTSNFSNAVIDSSTPAHELQGDSVYKKMKHTHK